MKTLLSSAILIFNFIFSFSQSINSWPELGSKWYYSYYIQDFYPYIGYKFYNYSNDTIIENKSFKVVKGFSQTKRTNFNGSIISDTIPLPNQYFYNSNDTVYTLGFFNQLQFLWHNNPNVGDIWDFGPQFDWYYQNLKNAYSQVDSIKLVTINGIVLKEIYSHSCKDTLGTPVIFGDTTSLFVNHIKCINTLFGPIYNMNSLGIGTIENYGFEPAIIQEIIEDTMLCFKSNSFPFHQLTEADCNYGVNIKIKEVENEKQFFVYPNPTNDILNITNPHQISTFQIYQMDGKLITQGITFPINIGDLKNGIYFLKITTKNKEIINQKIIKQ